MPKKTSSTRSTKRSKKKKNVSPNKIMLLSILAIILITAIVLLTFRKKDKIPPIAIIDEKPVEEVTEKPVERVTDAVARAAKMLGVPDNLVTAKVKDDGVYYYIALNKKQVDLNYANMIITGQVQLIGGELIEGNEAANQQSQTIIFSDSAANQKVYVEIYYDTKDRYEEESPKIAIVVDDFGVYSGELLDKYCALDPAVTFAIIPELRHSKDVMEKAVAFGHETIVHLPMEPLSYPKSDPGKNAIFVHQSDSEIERRVEGFIKSLPLCVGMNNHMGSLATSDERVMKAVLKVVGKHNLYFVDSFTSSSSVAYKVAQQMLIPSFKRDLFIDTPDITEKTLNKYIQDLKKMKENSDQVLVITHCTREKLNHLILFMEKVQAIGYEIVPVSALFESELPDII
ncbi:MAG: divergent polysaccharide deacetylase family protein [Candidatus Cloacimonetes bacterium]|nr:divergent polysaccharide deacetylase family protein [Candidatus Cloacimonadota bacterium]